MNSEQKERQENNITHDDDDDEKNLPTSFFLLHPLNMCIGPVEHPTLHSKQTFDPLIFFMFLHLSYFIFHIFPESVHNYSLAKMNYSRMPHSLTVRTGESVHSD